MGKFTLIAMTILIGLTTAEAKKGGHSGQNESTNKTMSEAGSKGKRLRQQEAAKLKESEKKAEEKSEEASAKGTETSKAAKRDSDEMKAAVAEKKETRKAAKESGEKQGKKKKSAWKFWKR